MSVALLSFHVVAECQSRGFSFPLGAIHNIFTLIVSFLLAVVNFGLTLIGISFLGHPRPHLPPLAS
jgi:ABC-type glucose/galactose transport system permease subunit